MSGSKVKVTRDKKNKKTAIRTEVVIENDVVLYVVVVTLRLQ